MRHKATWMLTAFLLIGTAILAISPAADNPRTRIVQQQSPPKTIHVADLQRRKIIGWLGRPLGEIVLIEGVVAKPSLSKEHSGATLLNVHSVNGHKLRKTPVFQFDPWLAELKKPKTGERFRYTGYETGGFRGMPARAFEFVPPVATTGFHFETSFVILRDENAPKKHQVQGPFGTSPQKNPASRRAKQNETKWQSAHPKWDEMRILLGKSIGSKEVLSFAKRYRLKRYAKFTSGGFSNTSEFPFSLLFEKLRIHRVVVVVDRNPRNLWPNGPVYRQKLPYGIKPTDTAEVVIRRVGKPSGKPDRNFVHYEGLGLSFVFDRDTHKLREIDLGVPKKPPAKSQSK